MKKFLSVLLISLFCLPFVVKADELVKVYLFESGGCPYCEDEINYLKSLDSYKEKFVIVEKELYIDHVYWKAGKDFKLGVKAALAFQDAGFTKAAYNGTPFVVISDLYATTNYNADLEDIILEAYDKGDKDVIGCMENGNDDCLEGYVDATYEAQATEIYDAKIESEQASGTATGSASNYSKDASSLSGNAILVFVLAIVVIFTIILVVNNVLSKNLKSENEEAKEEKEEKEISEEPKLEKKVEKKVVKKEPVKKTSSKSSKKTSSKAKKNNK